MIFQPFCAEFRVRHHLSLVPLEMKRFHSAMLSFCSWYVLHQKYHRLYCFVCGCLEIGNDIFLVKCTRIKRTKSVELILSDSAEPNVKWVQAVVGSIVGAFRRFKNPRSQEMSARGYALYSVCPQLSFFPFSNVKMAVSLESKKNRKIICKSATDDIGGR